MNKYFKKSTKRSVISMLSIAITLCLLFSLLFPGKAVNAAPRMRLNKTAVTLIQGKTVKLRVIGTKRKVTWKSSNKKIAKVNKIPLNESTRKNYMILYGKKVKKVKEKKKI